jgi:transcriptional regulator with XRE-family HTH domain
MITAGQLRAARALLKWTLKELADRAAVSINAITRYESEIVTPRRATLAAIQRAFEEAGVEFTNGGQPGVRLRKRG